MEKKNFFTVVTTTIVVIIVLLVIMSNLSIFSAKTEDSFIQAVKLRNTLAVAHMACQGDSISDLLEETIDSAGYDTNLRYRELEGHFTCNIKGTDEGKCIITGFYRREYVANAGEFCLVGWGDNVGSYQFWVDTGGPELEFLFKPDCGLKPDTTGCCKFGELTGELDLLCVYRNYEWEYYGSVGSLNIEILNGVSAHLWSNFSDKVETATGDYTCKIGGYKDFKEESYSYKKGLFKVKYVKCCPEDWIWREDFVACCGDYVCTNVYCDNIGGIFMHDTCWLPTGLGQSCDDIRPAAPLSMKCVGETAKKTDDDCVLHEKIWGAGVCSDPNCKEALDSILTTTNPFAPYRDSTTSECFYYNKSADALNPFDCTVSDPNLERLCPFKFTCPEDYFDGTSIEIPDPPPEGYFSGTCEGNCYDGTGFYWDGVSGNCYSNYLGHGIDAAHPTDHCIWGREEPCSQLGCTTDGCTD